MQKLLNLFKVIILVTVCFIVLNDLDLIADAKVINGFTHRSNYHPGDTAQVFINNAEKHRQVKFILFDKDSIAVDSIVSFAQEQPLLEQDDLIRSNQLSPTFSYRVPLNFPNGAYFWEHQVEMKVVTP